MNKLFLVGTVFMFGLSSAPIASAGFLDRLNQATSAVQQVQSAGRTAASVIPKKSSKNSDNSDNSTNPENSDDTDKPKTSGQPKRSSKKLALTKTSNPIQGTWGDQVTCSGPNSATCQNGMDNLVNCMHQSKGYYYRLIAANLEEKAKDPDWSPEDLSMLQADIGSVKAAVETDKVIDPDPNEPQRYLTFLSQEEQNEIVRVNAKYAKEVHDDCDKRFGGMSQYSSGK